MQTLSTQSALFSLSVAYMKTGVGVVEKVAFQHFCSHPVTESHPTNSPCADKGETNYAIHSNPQQIDGMDARGKQTGGKKTPPFTPSLYAQVKEHASPFCTSHFSI